MKGIRIGYGCYLTHPVAAQDAPMPSGTWEWQPYVDFQDWWNEQPIAHLTFPLLFGGIDTPEYLALVLAAGETDAWDRQHHPILHQLGNCVLPLERLSIALRERLTREMLFLAEQAWAQVCEDATARGLVLEQPASLLFIYEQDLCEDP